MRPRITAAVCLCLAAMVSSSTALAGEPTPRVLEPGLSIHRTITGIPLQSPFGMDIDQTTGDLYFIANNGVDIYKLEPDGSVGPIVEGIGPFGDRDADLRLGPDGLLYAIGPPEEGLSFIDRIDLDGVVQERSNNFIGVSLSAFGLDFDCVGQLYLSDNSSELLRLEQNGFLNIVSEGWNDIDEIEQGPDNVVFVHHNQRDRVFLQKRDGTRQVYVQGLSNIRGGRL